MVSEDLTEEEFFHAESEDAARRHVLTALIKQKVKKSDNEWNLIETYDKLEIYQESEKLTHLLKEKLDSTQMDYVEKKLALSKSHAARHMAKQMSSTEDPTVTRQKHLEAMMDINPLLNDPL